MYASNLQELLFHCSQHSDVSPQAFAAFQERFNALRSYGHLPKGRDQSKRLLTPLQIAAAILGLVPMHPAWAGHGGNYSQVPVTCWWPQGRLLQHGVAYRSDSLGAH